MECVCSGSAAVTEGPDVTVRGDRRTGLNTAIKAYLTSLDPEALNDVAHRRVREILTFATDMEQAGDIVDKTCGG